MTEYTQEKKGFRISTMPKAYPLTGQQKKLRGVLEECGVKKGISKAELQKAMIDCVGPKMKKKD